MWVTSMPQVWDEEGVAKGSVVTPAPATALLGSLAGWMSRAVEPPAPRPCGTEGGPPVTATRLRLRDGRHLAYCESGVPKEEARFKVVFSHGFTGSREDSVRASQVNIAHPHPCLHVPLLLNLISSLPSQMHARSSL
jgi:hypothetical protein